MLSDKAMLLTILVFVLVIAVTYIIYRQSFEYSWLIAIGTGTILGIILFLVGGIVLEADVNILVIFLGSIGGAVIALIAQFFKGVLDYSRTETVQFEDDEYYYYVKAVPKVKVSEQNVKVQKISGQTVRSEEEKQTAARRTAEQPVHKTAEQPIHRTAEQSVHRTMGEPTQSVRRTVSEHPQPIRRPETGRPRGDMNSVDR